LVTYRIGRLPERATRSLYAKVGSALGLSVVIFHRCQWRE
jgi:hypothetical protein